jgi:hypothetical protein
VQRLGLDIASTMIDRAPSSCGTTARISRGTASGSVDFVSCLLVLQHLPSRDAPRDGARQI